MVTRVSVEPRLLVWARTRAGIAVEDLASRFPRLAAWEASQISPTMRQLQDYAAATHTPIGTFFLDSPPADSLPIPDFRTFRDEGVSTPSPDLLDTIYDCQRRQSWYRDFAVRNGHAQSGFVSRFAATTDPEEAASDLQRLLAFSVRERSEFRSWSAALSGLAVRAEAAGTLVMISGIVGSNTHRKLNPEEFRGFALVDDLAPVVFVNGVDTKAAQIFTLVHELGHLGLGESAVSRPNLEAAVEDSSIEQWCNTFAAEFLAPRASLAVEFDRNAQLTEELERLARIYKSSTLVVLRRLRDIDLISRDRYFEVFRQERARILALMDEASQLGSSGGDFYNVQPVRVSKRFARSIISDTLEGNTPYRDAARLLGFRKQSTFEALGERLGVVA